MNDPIRETLEKLAVLFAELHELAAPYDAQLQHLQVTKADALASLTFQIETLQAEVRPLILAAQRTSSVDGCTAQYIHKETWDSEALRRVAEEIPAVLQCVRDSSYVVFRGKVR